MERPPVDQIWLPEPITIGLVKITRTMVGLQYYLHHWQHVQTTAAHKLDKPAAMHLQKVIDNLIFQITIVEDEAEANYLRTKF